MADNYFSKLKEQTSTRLWINNPTMADVDLALEHGAVSCTTNPTYAANMLKRDSEYALGVVDECLKESSNDDVVADLVQQKLCIRVLERFAPIYDASGGVDGFVSVQGDPHKDTDTEHIIAEALRHRKLGRNYIAKIPAIGSGLKAIEHLIAEDVPVIFTEVFGLAQMVYSCDMYREASESSGKKPEWYVTHITGIFDEYLQGYVEREGVDIAPEVLGQAGLAVARKQYHLAKERGYNTIMLGGGARGTHHFSELVGGEWHITINWSTAAEILEQDPPIENTVEAETSQEIIDELMEKLSDFRKAWLEDGLTLEEFKDYGPVQFFRNNFTNGWDTLLETIRKRRD